LTQPKLLSGGNPQIAKGYGEAPVRAYLDAVPGWKQAVCRRIDAVVSNQVAGVEKAIKWNSPFYGTERDSWFLSFHCYGLYVKVTFFRGAELTPTPAETSRYPAVRYHHVREGEDLGEQFAEWIRQAAALPGTRM
jgi:hypothetical protein